MLPWPAPRRPRWNFRYVLCTLVASYVLICLLFDMPFFSSKLPKYSGQYEVGTIDVEVPVQKARIAETVFKDTGKPAFEVETVLFSLYYPAVQTSPVKKSHHPWVPNIAQHAEGYAKFAHMNNYIVNNIFSAALWTLVGSTTIPAKVDAPLHGAVQGYTDYETQHPDDDYGLPQFPVIVWSHGMASGRTSYTQYCGELASRGFIVAAVEHRDGSGPGSLVYTRDGPPRDVLHFGQHDLSPEPEIEELKKMQLSFRQAEVEETARILGLINDGKGKDVFERNFRKEGTDLAAWRNRLDMKQVVVGGHSYGATLALQALKGAPSDKLPFVGGIILDPGKQSGPLNDDIQVPILVVHSQSWSAKHSIFHGRPHFEVVKELVNKAMDTKKGRYAWFMTAKGTTHPSVTDAPLIEPLLLSWTTGSTIDARDGVLQYVKVSREFMLHLADGHRKGMLAEEVTHDSYDNDVRGDQRKANMNREHAKYWQVHVAPSTACPYPGACGVDPD